jgi:ABC-2 type transport system permease protein
MSKVWLIAERQFAQEVLKKSFLFALLSLPLFLGLTIGMGAFAANLRQPGITLGYVDQAGLLTRPLPEPGDQKVKLVPLETPQAARTALEAGQIDAYYVLPADYGTTQQVELVYFTGPEHYATRQFQRLVRHNLLGGRPPDVVERALSGPEMTVRAARFNRDFPTGAPDAGQMLPLAAALLFSFLILTTSSTLMQALVAEKENRTMEIIVSSVSPSRVMAGKVIGILGMALTLLVGWVAVFLAAAWLGGNVFDIEWLQEIRPNWRDVWLLAMVAIPSSLFISAFMTMLGASVVETQEAQQAGSLCFLLVLLPIYLVIPMAKDPYGPLAVAGSLFPMTAVPTLGIRSVFAEVPLGQFITSAAISLFTGVLMVWLAGKAFRISMLRYGQRLRLGELFGQSRVRSSFVVVQE